MIHALDGGLWLHRFTLWGEAMAHLVSSNRELLLEAGRLLSMKERWLQHKPLRHPRAGRRVEAWHWDLRGPYLEMGLRLAAPRVTATRSPALPRHPQLTPP